jgi:hypothetical protein
MLVPVLSIVVLSGGAARAAKTRLTDLLTPRQKKVLAGVDRPGARPDKRLRAQKRRAAEGLRRHAELVVDDGRVLESFARYQDGGIYQTIGRGGPGSSTLGEQPQIADLERTIRWIPPRAGGKFRHGGLLVGVMESWTFGERPVEQRRYSLQEAAARFGSDAVRAALVHIARGKLAVSVDDFSLEKPARRALEPPRDDRLIGRFFAP